MSEHLRIAAAFKGNTQVPMGTPQSGGAFPETHALSPHTGPRPAG
jgi:hypothetical protein